MSDLPRVAFGNRGNQLPCFTREGTEEAHRGESSHKELVADLGLESLIPNPLLSPLYLS